MATSTTSTRTYDRRQFITPPNSQYIFLLLVGFRLCNALGSRTFFQPDEYFQSLEPAWQIVFGNNSGAWITWEWKQHLRSSIHPLLFAGVYRLATGLATLFNLTAVTYADLLLVAPKVVQAVFAALTDYYTWRLAGEVYHSDNGSSSWTLLLTIFSPWQWFCSTRTLSNCLETTLTSAALYYWPWEGMVRRPEARSAGRWQFRLSICLAALATILRPTNIMIWAVIVMASVWLSYQMAPRAIVSKFRDTCVNIGVCGIMMLSVSAAADRYYYQRWVFPPLRFIHFNIVQSLAVFYGKNRPDYYLTEGIPLLLTTALPFALYGLFKASRGTLTPGSNADEVRVKQEVRNEALAIVALREINNKRRTDLTREKALATVVILMIAVLSLISHKEVRFIYPLLPVLHVLAGGQVKHFFGHPSQSRSWLRQVILITLLAFNICLAGYAQYVHQRGVMDVMHYLRHEYQEHYLAADRGNGFQDVWSSRRKMEVGFMMPCHSTPWRSHLIYPGIDAWALTCEPPLDIPLSERGSYRDEADQFYDDTPSWLASHMAPVSTNKQDAEKSKRTWPEYLVFFEQLQPALKAYLTESAYRECWRGFNSHFHDDWRRKGDVLVWCQPELRTS